MSGNNGMAGVHRPDAETVEWYTPPFIFDALGLEFDLDPCSPPGGLPWVPARRFYSQHVDGLSQRWEGRVWMNPPYGPATEEWMRRFVRHRDGVALLFARTDTSWFHESIIHADALCFLRGRLTFVADEDGTPAGNNSGAPSVLVGCGEECADAVANCGLGWVVRMAEAREAGGQASFWG